MLEVKNVPLGFASRKLSIPLEYAVHGANVSGRQWQCGDSYFTKHSSCSFDQAAFVPDNPLSPLHPSIRPLEQDKSISQPIPGTSRSPKGPSQSSQAAVGDTSAEPKCKSGRKPHFIRAHSVPQGPTLLESGLPANDRRSAGATHLVLSSSAAQVQCLLNTKSEELFPGLPLSEIGRASRFNEKALGPRARCNVFEVVLQRKEASICPACAKSSKRAKLPARKSPCLIHTVETLTSYLVNRCARNLRTALKGGDAC
jgi:hypothetical protein